MAFSSLKSLGMGQEALNGGSPGILMPKLKYRFRVLFTGFGVDTTTELTKQVMTCGRPGVTFENVELSIYNSKVNYAGRYTWDDVQIVLRDDANNTVSKLVGQQIQKQFDFFEQSSAATGGDYKFQTQIDILDGGNGSQHAPSVLESFVMYGCYLQHTQYQQGDYKTSDPMDITLTLKYDNALQTDASGSGYVGIGLGTNGTGGQGFSVGR